MQVYLWGLNTNHQVRPNGKKRIKIPQKMAMPITVSAVCFSKSLMMILSANGDVFEYRSINSIKRIGQLHSVAKLEAGDYHYAAVTRRNQLFTWGVGDSGCLGIPPTQQQITPRKVALDIVDVFCCPSSTFMLTDSNQLYACGDNTYGQLGVGTTDEDVQLSKVSISTIVTKVASDLTHTLFLTSQGQVFVSGYNKAGCLGLQSTGQKINIPIRIASKQKFVSIGCGGYSAAVSQKGSIYVWGFCPAGLTTTPTVLDKINKRFVEVNLFNSNGYARSEDGQLWVWGDNRCGELGVGDIEQRSKPFPVILLDSVHVNKVFVGLDSVLCLTEEKTNYYQTFKRPCCEKRRMSSSLDKSLRVSRGNYRSPSVGRSTRSRCRNQKSSRNKTKEFKLKQNRYSIKQNKYGMMQGRRLQESRCPIKVVDDYCESVIHPEFQGTYSSIPNFESTITNKNRSIEKSEARPNSKLQQAILENYQLRQIIQQKDLIIEDITTKIQALQEAIEERDSRDQLTLRQHIVKEVQRMQSRYIGQISKLSGVIQNFALRYNTETINSYDPLVQRQLRESISKQNLAMNVTSKCKGKQINTEESFGKSESKAFKTLKPNASRKILDTEQKQNSTINHNEGKMGREEELKNRIRQLQNTVSVMTEQFEAQLQNSHRQMDMYRHKIKELTRVVAEKNQIIQQLSNQSLNQTYTQEDRSPYTGQGRTNHHMNHVIESIQRNKKRINESADKLMNILEASY